VNDGYCCRYYVVANIYKIHSLWTLLPSIISRARCVPLCSIELVHVHCTHPYSESLCNYKTRVFADLFSMRGDNLPRTVATNCGDLFSGIFHEVGCSHRGLQKFFSATQPLTNTLNSTTYILQIQQIQSPPFHSTLHEPRITFKVVNKGAERHH
jgi:hypothetical protein